MKWEAKPIIHKGENRIAIYFEKNNDAILRIKKLESSRWSATLKAWHLPDNKLYRTQFTIDFDSVQQAKTSIKITLPA